MRRRKFLIGTGSLAAAGAAGLGTGAFASVEATRQVGVDVTGDGSAYLGLMQTSPYAEMSDSNQLVLDFSENGEGGHGVNKNAVTTFDGVFRMTNNGPNPLDITIDKSSLGNPDRWHFVPKEVYEEYSGNYPEDSFYPSFDDVDIFKQNTSGGGLGPGESTLVSVAIDTRDKKKLPGGEIAIEVVKTDGPYGSE